MRSNAVEVHDCRMLQFANCRSSIHFFFSVLAYDLCSLRVRSESMEGKEEGEEQALSPDINELKAQPFPLIHALEKMLSSKHTILVR